jgi:pSer/pThr/pTyr-binding forkhead associated (FHA) protein
MLVLRISEPGQEPRELALEAGQTYGIGRKFDCYVRSDNATVSARHARLTVDADERVSIVDLGSSYGVFVNDRRCVEARVEPGDEIRAGDVGMTLERR